MTTVDEPTLILTEPADLARLSAFVVRQQVNCFAPITRGGLPEFSLGYDDGENLDLKAWVRVTHPALAAAVERTLRLILGIADPDNAPARH